MEGARRENAQDDEKDFKMLKDGLKSHRALLLLLNKVIEWEPIHIPAAVIGIITLLFALIWYIEPSILTLFSLLGLVVTVVDFVSPILSNHFYSMESGSKTQWNERDETQYEKTCSRLLNCRNHFRDGSKFLSSLKSEKPQIYMLMVVGALVFLAWIGSLIDNLLLLYLIVIFAVLVPGLRKHGILQKITSKIPDLKSKLQKTKTN